MRRTGGARALRGIAAGVVTTFLALVFHVIGGGAAPGPLALAVCLLAVVWVSVLIGRRRPSLPLLVVAVGVSQVVLHTAFSITTGSATIGGAAHAGHGDGLLTVGDLHGGHAMWQAHVVAGLLTVLAIRRGEGVLARLRELSGVVARALGRLVSAVVPPSRSLAFPLQCLAVIWAGPLVASGVGSVLVRRGPPALAV